MYRKAFLVWCLIILAETIHGIARGLLLQPIVGDFRARQIAVFTGSLIILGVAVAFVRRLGADNIRKLLKVGLLWLGLTLAFEIALGRLLFGYSWQRIGSDYNVLEGGLLPFGMVVLALSPLLAAKIRGLV